MTSAGRRTRRISRYGTGRTDRHPLTLVDGRPRFSPAKLARNLDNPSWRRSPPEWGMMRADTAHDHSLPRIWIASPRACHTATHIERMFGRVESAQQAFVCNSLTGERDAINRVAACADAVDPRNVRAGLDSMTNESLPPGV